MSEQQDSQYLTPKRGAMMDHKIHVAFATDDNYAQHLGVTICSMMEHTDAARIVAHIVCLSVKPDNIRRLEQVFLKYPQVGLILYPFNVKAYSRFRVDGHISLASYVRLFLADLLPPDVERLVYLDSDLCVLADIVDLADISLDGAVIAAAPDVYADENERLGLPHRHEYFNAGILVMDLAAWRSLGLTAAAQHYVEENSARLLYHDQDTLNALLHDRVKPIEIAWNYQARFRREDLCPEPKYLTKFTELACVKPKIIHYTTHLKPWYFWTDIPYEREYLKFIKKTAWADFKQPDKNWKSVLRRYMNRFSPEAAIWLTRILARLRRPVVNPKAG